MTLKTEVQSAYLTQQRQLHGAKVWCNNVRALLTGDAKPGSIGEAIRLALEADGDEVISYKEDVRHPYPGVPLGNALICCHGVMALDWFEDAVPEKMAEILDVNVLGTAWLVRAFVRRTLHTPERKRIILIGSMAHRVVLNGSAMYCASKAALAMLARCLAWELAPKGFDVFCIHPSNTLGTPMSEETIQGLMRYRGLTYEEATAYWNDSPIRATPLTPAHIVALVRFLLTTPADYLSGAQLELTGGQR